MNLDPITKNISVHGREALNLPYTRFNPDDTQADISDATMFLEIPGANMRRPLQTDSSDTKGLRIYLSRTDVEKIPMVATQYIIVDETDPIRPLVEIEGKIFRTGYKGEPIS